MNISLPESMREWIDKRLAEGGYGTASELIRDLVRREQLRLEREAINGRLRAALNSGPSMPVTEESWKARYREIEDGARQEKRAG